MDLLDQEMINPFESVISKGLKTHLEGNIVKALCKRHRARKCT